MIEYIKNITRKAWWLIGWSTVYALFALGYLAYEISNDIFMTDQSKFSTVLMLVQMVWVLIAALPLIPGTRLHDWLFTPRQTYPYYVIIEQSRQMYVVGTVGGSVTMSSGPKYAIRYKTVQEANAARDMLQTNAGPRQLYTVSTIYRIPARKAK